MSGETSLAIDRGEALGVTLRGSAVTSATELLRSPASATPCVHWRLRIVETMGPGVELVHDVVSPEGFELVWSDRGGANPRRVRLPSDARIEALPVLHRDGSPGAVAVARQFGFEGSVRVEEIVVRAEDALEVDGVLIGAEPADALPFRRVDLPTELVEATVRIPGRLRKTNLLPWALGTAAALAGTVGIAATVAREVAGGGKAILRAVVSGGGHAEIGPIKLKRPRWP